MRPFPPLLLLTLLVATAPAALLPAQSPRPPVLVGDALGSASGPAVASAGNLAVLAWHDSADESIRVAVSDGRGLAWSAPVRADAGVPAVKIFEQDGLAVAGDTVYVLWRDRRNLPGGTAEDLFLQVSRAAGASGSWLPADLPVDKGLPGGGNDVRFVHLAVDPRGPGDADDVVAVLATVQDDATGLDRLFLNVSTDGARTFLPAALPVSTHGGGTDVDECAVAVDGGVVHMAWRDDFLSPGGADDPWYAAWDAAGAAFLARDVQLDPLASGILDADDDVALAVRGGVLVALWQADSAATAGPEELRGAVSTSGPLGWGLAERIGGYTPGVDDVDLPAVAVLGGGSIVAAWQDDRTGSDAVYAAHWSAGTWGGEARLSPGPGIAPGVVAAGDSAAVLWTAARTGPDPAEAALWDAAAGAFAPAFALTANSGDVDLPAAAWNELYGNLLAAWRANDLGANDAWAGGFRPQTLVPAGDFTTPGSPVHFEVRHWPAAEAGSFAFGVLVSGSIGSLFLPDGRDLGLAPDPILAYSRGLIPGPLSGAVAADGTGATPAVPAPPLPGPLAAVAVAFRGPGLLGALTDPVPLP